jgi:hypothetical protein
LDVVQLNYEWAAQTLDLLIVIPWDLHQL